MNRFVVLHHRFPATWSRNDHFDFMLEKEESLLSWVLPLWPLSAEPVDVKRIDDHRKSYLDYEGPVSNDRGEVSRVDAGRYVMVAKTEHESEHELAIRLEATEQAGEYRLSQSAGQRWIFERLH